MFEGEPSQGSGSIEDSREPQFRIVPPLQAVSRRLQHEIPLVVRSGGALVDIKSGTPIERPVFSQDDMDLANRMLRAVAMRLHADASDRTRNYTPPTNQEILHILQDLAERQLNGRATGLSPATIRWASTQAASAHLSEKSQAATTSTPSEAHTLVENPEFSALEEAFSSGSVSDPARIFFTPEDSVPAGLPVTSERPRMTDVQAATVARLRTLNLGVPIGAIDADGRPIPIEDSPEDLVTEAVQDTRIVQSPEHAARILAEILSAPRHSAKTGILVKSSAGVRAFPSGSPFESGDEGALFSDLLRGEAKRAVAEGKRIAMEAELAQLAAERIHASRRAMLGQYAPLGTAALAVALAVALPAAYGRYEQTISENADSSQSAAVDGARPTGTPRVSVQVPATAFVGLPKYIETQRFSYDMPSLTEARFHLEPHSEAQAVAFETASAHGPTPRLRPERVIEATPTASFVEVATVGHSNRLVDNPRYMAATAALTEYLNRNHGVIDDVALLLAQQAEDARTLTETEFENQLTAAANEEEGRRVNEEGLIRPYPEQLHQGNDAAIESRPEPAGAPSVGDTFGVKGAEFRWDGRNWISLDPQATIGIEEVRQEDTGPKNRGISEKAFGSDRADKLPLLKQTVTVFDDAEAGEVVWVRRAQIQPERYIQYKG